MDETKYDLPNGLDSDVRDRIRRCRKTQEAQNSTSGKVTKELCDLIHEMDSKDVPHSNIISAMPFSSQHTLYYHLREECQHKYRSRITYSECGWMRIYAKQGAPLQTLSLLFNLSTENTSIHLSGKCGHEDMLEPVPTEQLRSNSVDVASIVTSICPICDEEFTHKEYRDRTTCSEQCRNIYASRRSNKTR